MLSYPCLIANKLLLDIKDI